MRSDKDAIFMRAAFLFAERSTCLSRNVGAVLVKDGRVIATGYNGAVSGYQHCCDKNVCLRRGSKSGENLDSCVAVHAELNALLQCALHGVSSSGATVYCTDFPCPTCLKSLINAGVVEIVYARDYKNDIFDKLCGLVAVRKLVL